MRIANDAMTTGVQSYMKDFYAGCCNIESIVQCDAMMNGQFIDKQRMAELLTKIAIQPKVYGCNSQGYVNSSYDLLHAIGSPRREVFRDCLDVAKTSKYWKPGAVGVARFKYGNVEHSVVFRVVNADDYEVIYDGYGMSHAVRYGNVNSVRFYA